MGLADWSPVVLLAALAVSGSVWSEPPPGHPSPGAAGDLLQMPGDVPDAQLTRSGVVLRAVDSNAYTYIELREGADTLWLAAPRTALVPGQVIRFAEGTPMRNFYSRKLKISFPSILFVRRVVVAGRRS